MRADNSIGDRISSQTLYLMDCEGYDCCMYNFGITSNDKNRVLGNVAEKSSKFLFKWFGIGLVGFINFVKLLLSSALGK